MRSIAQTVRLTPEAVAATGSTATAAAGLVTVPRTTSVGRVTAAESRGRRRFAVAGFGFGRRVVVVGFTDDAADPACEDGLGDVLGEEEEDEDESELEVDAEDVDVEGVEAGRALRLLVDAGVVTGVLFLLTTFAAGGGVGSATGAGSGCGPVAAPPEGTHIRAPIIPAAAMPTRQIVMRDAPRTPTPFVLRCAHCTCDHPKRKGGVRSAGAP